MPVLNRSARAALLGMMAYQGFSVPLLGVAAPWVARRFELSSVGVARLYAAMSLAALITFGIARVVDRSGRRRVMLVCLTLASAFALGEALAQSVTVFAVLELLRFAMAGAIGTTALTLLAESEGDSSSRAAAVGRAGMAAALGGAVCLALAPLLSKHSYRAMFLLASAGVLFVPFLVKSVPESARWRQAQQAGSLAGTSLFSVFERPWRRRSVALLMATLLGAIEGAAVGTWSYYYGVSVVGMSAASMSTWSVVATLAGFLGFRVGAASSEHFGRVRTAVLFGLLHQAGELWIYLGPPKGFAHPGLWIGLGLCAGGLTASAFGTAKSTAGVELFPTRVRVTMMGWLALAGAVATGGTQLLISALIAPLGGLSYAIALLSLTGVVGVIVFGLFVDETRGLSLENAALESSSSVETGQPDGESAYPSSHGFSCSEL